MEFCTNEDIGLDGNCKNCGLRHPDSDKLQAVELSLDGVDIAELKKECFRLVYRQSIPILEYPNVAKVAGCISKDLSNLAIKDLAEVLGRTGKIPWIKEIRTRYNLGLLEAKLMADGMWRQKGWE